MTDGTPRAGRSTVFDVGVRRVYVHPMYTTLKLIHILASIVWLGSGFALLLITTRMVRAHDYTGALALGRQSDAFGRRVFGPAAMTTLVAGVAMVVVGDLSFVSLWIVIGLVGVALSFVFGAVLGERAARDLRDALPAQQSAGDTAEFDHDDIERARRRLVAVSGVDLAILAIVVWAMVFKPGM